MTLTTLQCGRVIWTDIVNPSAGDISQLSQAYPQLHPLNLQDCLNELEFPKLDHHDDYLFLVFQFPIWVEAEALFRPAEVDIFVARSILVTSHRGQLPALEDLFRRARDHEAERQALMGRGASPLLYALLSALVDSCFPITQPIVHTLRHIEQNLFRDNTRHLLAEIARVRRNTIALHHILKPQLEVVRELERGSWPWIHEDLDLYWSDIGDHLAQLSSMLDEDSDVVGGLSETVDTLASHRIDEVVRLLTIVTVLTLPLTLLATVFGMNIVMPFSEHPLLFFSILGLGLVITILLVWYLRRRDWL